MRQVLLSSLVLIFWALPAAAQDIPLAKILIEKESWRDVPRESEDIKFSSVTFLDAKPKGSIVVYQGTARAVIGVNGKLSKAPPPSQPQDVRLHSEARTRAGVPYYIDPKHNSVFAAATKTVGALRLPGLTAPTSLTFWPDDGHLVIGEADGAYLWAVRIEADGSFGPGDRYYSLRTRPGEKMHVTGMTMDAGYRLYACTPLGVQVFDPTGRLSGVIPSPAKETLTAITIGGPNADTLFVAAGSKIYARPIQGKASYTWKK